MSFLCGRGGIDDVGPETTVETNFCCVEDGETPLELSSSVWWRSSVGKGPVGAVEGIARDLGAANMWRDDGGKSDEEFGCCNNW